MMKFFKYQGCGNDFVMIDNRTGEFSLYTDQIAQICHRRFGIGADGLILLEKHSEYDFKMVYFNADGGEGSMCGNGGRCVVQFAADLGIFKINTTFLAIDGPHEASIENDLVSLGMSDVTNIEPLPIGIFLNTGSPHLIIKNENIDSLDIKKEGSEIRFSEYWKKRGGVNVNFTEELALGSLYVRTYERGVEDETYACGTGVTAAALEYASNKTNLDMVSIKTLGGTLIVSFNKNNENNFTNIFLKGPAECVFEGEISI